MGGKMVLGNFEIQAHGQKLAMALGLPHFTGQDIRDNPALKNSTAGSAHYRRLAITQPGNLVFNKFPVQVLKANLGANNPDLTSVHGNSAMSSVVVNMFANDSVYVRCPNLPSNAYETLNGNVTNIMAVIPLYSGSGSDNFHSPQFPTSCRLGKMGVDCVDIRLTDAYGEILDLNGVEWEFQLMFETFPNVHVGPKVRFAHGLPGAHSRDAAPKPINHLSNMARMGFYNQ